MLVVTQYSQNTFADGYFCVNHILSGPYGASQGIFRQPAVAESLHNIQRLETACMLVQSTMFGQERLSLSFVPLKLIQMCALILSFSLLLGLLYYISETMRTDSGESHHSLLWVLLYRSWNMWIKVGEPSLGCFYEKKKKDTCVTPVLFHCFTPFNV